jgi:hypothetical protein
MITLVKSEYFALTKKLCQHRPWKYAFSKNWNKNQALPRVVGQVGASSDLKQHPRSCRVRLLDDIIDILCWSRRRRLRYAHGRARATWLQLFAQRARACCRLRTARSPAAARASVSGLNGVLNSTSAALRVMPSASIIQIAPWTGEVTQYSTSALHTHPPNGS